MLSAADVAWADSCLTKDPDLLESGWNSLKEALLETLNAQHYSSTDEKDEFLEGAKTVTFSSENTGDARVMDENGISIAANNEGAKPDSDVRLSNETVDDFWSKHSKEDIFLPTYNENLRDLGASDPEADLFYQEFELEESTEDIFRVWDLGIRPEEDELIKQLNKALAESSLQPTSSVSDDSNAWRDSNDESIDDLVSGIADLALSPDSS